MASTYTNRRAGDAAARQDILGKELSAPNSRNEESTQGLRAELVGSNTCTAVGIVGRGAAPALALCRQLLAAGVDPNSAMQVFRNGTLALKIRRIGEAAKLTVEQCSDGRPRFRPYRPHPSEVAPPIA